MGMRQRRQQRVGEEVESNGGSSKGEASFRTHLTVFLVTGLFLFSLNLLTSPGDLWFYWPLFFWGWAVAIHALVTYGPEAPSRTLGVIRGLLPTDSSSRSSGARLLKRPSTEAPFAAASFAQVHDQIEQLKGIAWQLPEGSVRDQVLRVAHSAERIAGVMAADRADAASVDRFTSHYLEPTVSLLTRYARLSGRGVAGAEDILRRVEEENLPLLESRLDELYDRLHRGEIIQLAATSEMLDFDVPDLPSATVNSRS